MRNIVIFASILSFALPAFAGTSAKDNPAVEVRGVKAGVEQHERNVDMAALQAQEISISRLTALARKYQGTRQEPVFLAKLGDLQLQLSSIVFRIAHGAATKGKGIDIKRYNRSLTQAIGTFSTLIAKYPNYPEIVTAYHSRGKAYEEIGNQAGATKDYLHVVKNFPDSEEAIPSYMSLAEFSITANDHPTATRYLKEVEKHPESPYYPFALYKLAWSSYNLKNIPAALSYAQRQITYYNEHGAADAASKDDGAATSDYALKENTLLDVTVFYFEGYEEKLPQYSSEGALDYFRKIETGPALGRMMVRYGKLLRSHDHGTDLLAFKDQVLASESKRPEALDVLLTTYEFQQNQRHYEQLTGSAQDIVHLFSMHRTYEVFAKARKMILDTCDAMQTLIVKNKGATEAKGLSVTLAKLYSSFTQLVEDSDPRIPRVHYNLAETLFTIRDFAGATEHYRWVVDHGSWKGPGSGDKPVKLSPEDKAKGLTGVEGTVPDSSLKAIAARYEVLRERKLIPTQLAARSLKDDRSDAKLEPALAEWIAWIDTHVSHADKPEARKAVENFVFESNRALYAQDHLRDALERFKKFTSRFEGSTYVIPSASLVLDTYIASAEWEKTHELASDLLKQPAFQKGEFQQRLYLAASDSYYKLLEAQHQAKQYGKAIKMAEEFVSQYPKSARLADALSLAGAAALAQGDKKLASEYFTRLIKSVPRDGNAHSIGAALLARGALSEERYDFAQAAADYRIFLTFPVDQVKIEESQADKLRRKTLALSWLAGDMPELKAALDQKAICNESLAAECDKYIALMILGNPAAAREEKMTDDAFERAHTGKFSETRPIWAAVALEGAKHLAFRDRNKMLRALANGWSDLDATTRFAMLPYISVSAPHAFQLNRFAMKEVAPLRADEKYITHRVDMIREMENAATALMKMPWARVRAEVLNENAALYLDLARGLTELPAPKSLSEAEKTVYDDTIRKLTLPFEEKGQDMRAKAFQIASRGAIEEADFAAIAEPFFAENPSQARKLKLDKPIDAPAPLDLAYLSEMDHATRWASMLEPASGKGNEDAATAVKGMWARAVQTRRWAQIAFFMQEAREKKLLAPGMLGVVKAVSFATAGARAEALAELEDARQEFLPETKTAITVSLVHYYLKAMARDKTKSLMKDVPLEKLNREQAALAAIAMHYLDPEASSRLPAGAKR